MSSSTSSSEPLRLLLRALAFGTLPLGVLVAAMCWGPHASRVDYMGGLEQKHTRLHSLPSPKVIIIGGSNAAFGIDSERLEEALCRPVVNMSIHASLGYRFMVDEVIDWIGTDDLVIVALEQSGYSEPAKDNDMHLLAVDRFPEALGNIPWYLRPKVIAGIAVMRLQAAWKVLSGAWTSDEPDPVYRADGFNLQGDVISHLDRPRRDASRKARAEYREPKFAPEFVELTDALAQRVAEAQGTLVFAWPTVAQSSYEPEFHEAMRDGLVAQGYTITGGSQDYVYPDSSYYDTHQHLNAAGRQLRTSRLLDDLCGLAAVGCCVTLP